MLSYNNLIGELRHASQPKQCLELLAESRHSLGFDLVGFRHSVAEPLFQHFVDWHKWGQRFGWPGALLDDLQHQKKTPLAFVSKNSQTSMSRAVAVPWSIGPIGSNDGRKKINISNGGIVARLHHLGIDNGVTVMVSRSGGQLSSVVWVRAKSPSAQAPDDTDLKQLLDSAIHFLSAMDTSYAWRDFSTLSQRELQCLELAAGGFIDKKIAHKLNRSVETVRFHMKNAIRKLGANNRTHAVAMALTRNIIHSPRIALKH